MYLKPTILLRKKLMQACRIHKLSKRRFMNCSLTVSYLEHWAPVGCNGWGHSSIARELTVQEKVVLTWNNLFGPGSKPASYNARYDQQLDLVLFLNLNTVIKGFFFKSVIAIKRFFWGIKVFCGTLLGCFFLQVSQNNLYILTALSPFTFDS